MNIYEKILSEVKMVMDFNFVHNYEVDKLIEKYKRISTKSQFNETINIEILYIDRKNMK